MADSYAMPEYDAIKQRLRSQFSQQKSEDQDAMKRRFAANGMLNSGAYEKNVQLQDEATNRQEADAGAQVDLAAAQEAQRRKEVADAQQFQSAEAQKQREFATSERQGSQLFNKELFDKDMAFKQTVFSADQYWKGLDNEWRGKEFNENVKNNWITQLSNAMGDDWHDLRKRNDFINRLNELGIKIPAQ